MNLQERMSNDLKDAMRSKDEARLRALRSVRAEVLKKESEKAGVVVTDELILGLIQTLVKQRKDSIEMFRKGDRAELAAAEEAELAVLQSYLPAGLSEAEIAAIVRAVIAQTGAASAQDLGKLMGPVMAQCKATGKTVDGKLVNQLVRSSLAG